MWGVGAVHERKLAQAGITTIGGIALPIRRARGRCSAAGAPDVEFAHGDDQRDVRRRAGRSR